MRLSLNIDELPDWCSDGKLGINLLFDETGYKEMDIALEKVIKADNNRLAHLRDVMYGIVAPQFEKEDDSLQLTGLNESQNRAVKKIIAAKDIAIIHGPPGTGKTTTLVKAICEVLKTEKQVLVCSPSNTAVDLITEKLHREKINVLRLGNPARISDEVMMNTLDAKISSHTSYKEIKNFKKLARNGLGGWRSFSGLRASSIPCRSTQKQRGATGGWSRPSSPWGARRAVGSRT